MVAVDGGQEISYSHCRDGDDDEDPDEPDCDDEQVGGDPDEEDEISLRDAVAVVCEHLAVTEQEKAARIIAELARRARMDCWVSREDEAAHEELSALQNHVHRVLERYAQEDNDAAHVWLESASDEMWETVHAWAPRDDGNDSGDGGW